MYDEKDEIIEEIEETEKVDEKTKKEKKDKYKEKILKFEEELKEAKDKFLRNAAELENFKKRTAQERILDRKYASSYLISDLLLPLEQLNKIVNLPTEDDVLKNFLIGFKMINDQLYNILESDGLKRIESVGKPFDPNFHHAIEKVVDETKDNNIIVEETQTGYMYKDRILRPAMVKVNERKE